MTTPIGSSSLAASTTRQRTHRLRHPQPAWIHWCQYIMKLLVAKCKSRSYSANGWKPDGFAACTIESTEFASQMVTAQQQTFAANLIGKTVTGTINGHSVSGIATGSTLSGSTVDVTVNGQEMDVSQITKVTDPSLTGTTPDSGTGAASTTGTSTGNDYCRCISSAGTGGNG